MFVTRYNPRFEIENVRKGFEFFNDILNNLETTQQNSVIASFIPAVNTRDEDDAYYVEVDLPGVDKKDIEITTEDNILTISGERKLKKEMKEDDYYRVESSYGKFSRSFALPEKVDVNKIEAKNENGVLEIVIPKVKEEEKKPKKIKIK